MQAPRGGGGAAQDGWLASFVHASPVNVSITSLVCLHNMLQASVVQLQQWVPACTVRAACWVVCRVLPWGNGMKRLSAFLVRTLVAGVSPRCSVWLNCVCDLVQGWAVCALGGGCLLCSTCEFWVCTSIPARSERV